MRLSHLLQGRPLGVAIHPLVVHFPIAAFLISFVLDLIAFAQHSPFFAHVSFTFIVLGLITGAVAAIFGIADYTSLRHDSDTQRIGAQHGMINGLVMVIYAASLLARYTEDYRVTFVSFFFSAVGLAALMYSGYLGGQMVYSHGAAVGRHRRGRELPRETTVVDPERPTADGYVDVPGTAAMQDGDSRRVDVNGTIIVIARESGEYFAFQEFCTHRFGPLSEGTYENGTVMCPWHRSCFDMRTGQVKHGPAKEPINVYPVRTASDGTLQVLVSRSISQQ